MNLSEYIGCNCCHIGEKTAEDASVRGMKSPLTESFPHRIRTARRLIDSIPRDVARRIIEEGVSLIKSIPNEDRRIVKYILRVFDGRATRESMIAFLMRLGGIDEDKATIITDDQISKAVERFKVEKWKAQGCTKVRWVHKGLTNPREYHLRKWNGISGKRNGRPNGLNGYVFNINKPPVINLKTGERGYPGQMINCHCVLEPLW